MRVFRKRVDCREVMSVQKLSELFATSGFCVATSVTHGPSGVFGNLFAGMAGTAQFSSGIQMEHRIVRNKNLSS